MSDYLNKILQKVKRGEVTKAEALELIHAYNQEPHPNGKISSVKTSNIKEFKEEFINNSRRNGPIQLSELNENGHFDSVVQKPNRSIQLKGLQQSSSNSSKDVSLEHPSDGKSDDAPVLNEEVSDQSPNKYNLVEIKDFLVQGLADALYLEKDEIIVNKKFTELGLDSIIGVEWVRAINKRYALNISATKIYDYHSIVLFAQYLFETLIDNDRSHLEHSDSISIDQKISIEDSEKVIVKSTTDHIEFERTDIINFLIGSLSEALLVEREEINLNKKFIEMGMDSILGVEWVRAINKKYKINISVTKIYDKSTIVEFSNYLFELLVVDQNCKSTPLQNESDVAVISEVKEATERSIRSENKPKQTLLQELLESLSQMLMISTDELDIRKKFIEMGLDSILGVEWIRELNKRYGLKMTATKLYDHPSIASLSDYIHDQLNHLAQNTANNGSSKVTEVAEAKVVTINFDEDYGLLVNTVHTLEEIQIVPIEVRAPKEHEVCIKVKASAINFPDIMCVNGLYPTMPEYPFVPGFEVSGVISEVGAGVTEFFIGEEVIAITGEELGGHSSRVNVAIQNVVKKPSALSFEEACSLPVVLGTVIYAFELGAIKEGEHLLIQTATGGCGLAAIQLANLLNCVIYGTSSKDYKLDILKEIGIERGLNYATEQYNTILKEETSKNGVDVVLNMLAGEHIQKGIDSLGSGGRYLEIAVHALKTSHKLDLSELVHNQSFHSIDLRRLSYENGFKGREVLEKMVSMVDSQEIVPIVSKVYPISKIKEALEYVSLGQHIGKVVISHTASDIIDYKDQCIANLKQQKSRSLKFRKSAFQEVNNSIDQTKGLIQDGIAIIGMSGQFPKSNNLQEYWENISAGEDCITEVPELRWSIDDYYSPDITAPGKTNSKWMGALNDVDKFDALFFNISPVEAELMDPQQRLFLQNSWHCIEDAGMDVQALSNSKTGVYVGCSTGDYGQSMNVGVSAQGLVGRSSAILSARISYLLNLKGPCLAIDTACSSSLVAIAEACDSLILGNCDHAIAGGVCVLSGPMTHLLTAKTAMLSNSGKCYTFDERADGYVPGEGVGVLLLKRYSDALRDEDHIYGIIKGWGVNQDGKTNGITAPSVQSQISLEKAVYNRFDIHPETITMVEAHGTGTKLGDPIEVEALIDSFKEYTKRENFCALGSVKSNIGHLLTAAGAAGIIKVLLSLKNGKIPPTINFKSLNQHISLKQSPFYINTELKKWTTIDDSPRRASVSSFGFSGTNSFLVIEEHIEKKVSQVIPTEKLDNPLLFVLSAKSADRLIVYLELIKNYLIQNEQTVLKDLIYTLQIGREAMDYRFATLINSKDQLITVMDEFLNDWNGKTNINDNQGALNKAYFNRISPSDFYQNISTESSDEYLSKILRDNDLSKILIEWLSGRDIVWDKLIWHQRPKKISIPGYPFAKESYWLVDDTIRKESEETLIEHTREKLHALVHENVSDLSGMKFLSRFNSNELFLSDHKVNGMKTMPGVSYVEMIYAVTKMVASEGLKKNVIIKNIIWHNRLTIQEDTEVHLELNKVDDKTIDYKISTIQTEKVVLCEATVVLSKSDFVQPNYNIEKLTEEHPIDVDVKKCYDTYSSMGVEYGDSFRSIRSLRCGENGVFVMLDVASLESNDQSGYYLHPSILDGALQGSIGFIINNERSNEPQLPYAIDEITIFQNCPTKGWAKISPSPSNESSKVEKIDVDILDEKGRVCVRFKGYLSLRLKTEIQDNFVKIPPIEISEEAKETLPLGRIILMPKWDVVRPYKSLNKASERPGNTVVFTLEEEQFRIYSENNSDFDSIMCLPEYSIKSYVGLLENYESLRHVYFIAPCPKGSPPIDDYQIKDQENGLLVLFKIIKAVLLLGKGTKDLEWTIITQKSLAVNENDKIDATHASISGLVGSMAKEYPHWEVRLLDIEKESDLSNIDFDEIPFDKNGNPLIYREGWWYKQVLIPYEETPVTNEVYRDEGVYVVIGGAGGLGEVWSKYMITTYNASIVWIGRRLLNKSIEAKLDGLAKLGKRPTYISADASNKESLERAYNQIKGKFSSIHGVVHSAIVLQDESLISISEESFTRSLSAKINVSVRMAQVFQKENLDFILFFSSLVSILKNAGQSSYAAGCTFKDAFASQLRQVVSYPVKVMNWGYWGEVGIVSSEDYNKKMTEHGIASINSIDGEYGLNLLFSYAVHQVALLRTLRPINFDTLMSNDFIRINKRYKEGVATERLNSLEYQDLVLELASKTLSVDKNEIEISASFYECGFDDRSIIQFIDHLNTVLASKLEAADLLSQHSISDFANSLAGYNETQSLFSKIVHDEEILEFDRLNGLLNSVREESLADLTTLDDLLSHWLCAQFKSMNLLGANGSDINSIVNRLNPSPILHRWLNESLSILIERNLVAIDNDRYEFVEKSGQDLKLIREKWNNKREAWLESTIMRGHVVLAEATMNALPEILNGDIAAQEVLFPDSSLHLVEDIYRDNEVSDFYNELLAQTVVAYIEDATAQDSSRTFKILEIGAGTGGTTTALLHRLENHISKIEDYHFTDISNAFLLHGEESYSTKYPFMSFGMFDVEVPLESTSAKVGQYDIVVCGNVLHATKNISNTIRNVKATLKREGFLVINELSSKVIFAHLTFGLLDGWWLYEDEHLRLAGSPLIGSDQWSTLLQHEGFYNIAFPISNSHDMGHQIICGSSDGILRQERCSNVQTEEKNITTDSQSIITHKRQMTKPLSNDSSKKDLKKQVIFLIKSSISKIIKLDVEKIQTDVSFDKYGIDSILQTSVIRELEVVLGELSKTLLFEYNNTLELADFLLNEYQTKLANYYQEADEDISEIDLSTSETLIRSREKLNEKEPSLKPELDIAIIGVSGRYPMAKNLREYWENLKSGKNCISEAPTDRWPHLEIGNKIADDSGNLIYGGFLDEINRFDNDLFGIGHDEVMALLPETRMILETVWEAFEDAGYNEDSIKDVQSTRPQGIGVFIGSMYTQYPWMVPSRELGALSSNGTDWHIANRVSHYFNLVGPSMAVNSACSSSLTAIHQACESLLTNSSSMAIAGGVNLTLDLSKYEALDQVGFLDRGSKSKSFGDGSGFIPGEGVGVILLKPLAHARADGDKIYGIIKSSSINHNGGRQTYNTPDPKMQENLVLSNIARANVSAESISYVESAANGSKLGDSIEIIALKKSFAKLTKQQQFCAIGSVKSNIGHLEAASGISQVTKMILQFDKDQLVPSINASPLNSNINFKNSPFFIQDKLSSWSGSLVIENNIKRRAIVNSFGAGGTNVNLVLEEGESTISPASDTGVDSFFPFSANNEYSLVKYLERILEYLEIHSTADSDRISSHLIHVNNNLKHRVSFIASSRDDLMNKLTLAIYCLENVDAHEEIHISTSEYLKKVDDANEVADLIKYKELLQLSKKWHAGYKLDFRGVVEKRLCGPFFPKYVFDHHQRFDFVDSPNQEKSLAVDNDQMEIYRTVLDKISSGVISKEEAFKIILSDELEMV